VRGTRSVETLISRRHDTTSEKEIQDIMVEEIRQNLSNLSGLKQDFDLLGTLYVPSSEVRNPL